MEKIRIVVQIEIFTLLKATGKLCLQKMDRLTMILANLHNSGKEILVVTSGAIALGSDILQQKVQDNDVVGMMAAAAVGQAELIKLYQRYFDQYNQMVAQVLLTNEIMKNQKWKQNTQNTFETLLAMNIIPIINENDAVSTSDIELGDNYPLARNVAELSKSDLILIKSGEDEQFIIQPRNEYAAILVKSKDELFCELEGIEKKLQTDSKSVFKFPAHPNQMMPKTATL